VYCLILPFLSFGFFPHQWRRAIIHPIPKAGLKKYQPISLLSQIVKITERIFTWSLEQEISLRPNQFGCVLAWVRIAQHLSAT